MFTSFFFMRSEHFVFHYFRVQLTVAIHEVISCDFPEKWPTLVGKINGYLTSDVKEAWLGALLVLYQLVKKYE